MKYTTTLQVARALAIANRVPSRDVGADYIKEEVGTGDENNSVFYLDHDNILPDSCVLYYGETQSTTNKLVQSEDYELDSDTGKITLTPAGVSKLGIATIYAEYEYISLGISNSHLTDLISQAEKKVDNLIGSTFTNCKVPNPEIPKVVDELHYAKPTQRIFPNRLPILDITVVLNSDIGADDTSIELMPGNGSKLPLSGKLIIDKEVISYGAISEDLLTGVQRGLDGSAAASHSAGAEAHTTILSISNSEEGAPPVWSFGKYGVDYVVQEDNNIFIFANSDFNRLYQGLMRNKDVANRVKLIQYYYGFDFIPEDIVRLTILLVNDMLVKDGFAKNLLEGRDEFSPSLTNPYGDEIQQIVSFYRFYKMTNV